MDEQMKYALAVVAGFFAHAVWSSMREQAAIRGAMEARQQVQRRSHRRQTPGWEDRVPWSEGHGPGAGDADAVGSEPDGLADSEATGPDS